MAAVLVLPVMAPAAAAAPGLPTSLLGAYSFLMWTAALAASSGVGKLIGHFGAVRVAQTSLALCAVAVTCGATGLTAALVAMPALIGIACALETPASSEILARVTPPRSRTFIFSLKQTGVQTGGMLAGVLFPAALPVLGWRGAMAALAVLLLAGAAALVAMHRRLAARAPGGRPLRGGPLGLRVILPQPR